MHVVAADWYGPELSILATNAGELVQLSFEGPLDWNVEPGRWCVGRMTRDGHKPCPVGAEASADRNCSRCAPSWSDCVFEPVEHTFGERCYLCQKEHVVYLAFYGGLAKVGMTSSARVDVRLREQGADGFFIIQRRRDRFLARQTEKTVAFLHGIPERRRSTELLPQWTRAVDDALLERRAGEWHNVLAQRFDVEDLVRIEHTLPVLPGPPALMPIEGKHEGAVLGAKGNHLIYQANNAPLGTGSPVHAIKRSELVGRRLSTK